MSNYNKSYYDKHKEKSKFNYQNNKEKRKETSKKYYQENKERE
jgi:hypothetical protein